MKTVILFGSPRKDGNTHALVDVFARRLREKQHEVSVLYLGDLNICPCRGCLSCLEKGECRIDDDMEQVRRHITEAEVVVYATPIYWFGPSAQLKLVMDRSISFLDGTIRRACEARRRSRSSPAPTRVMTRVSRPSICSGRRSSCWA